MTPRDILHHGSFAKHFSLVYFFPPTFFPPNAVLFVQQKLVFKYINCENQYSGKVVEIAISEDVLRVS